MSTIMGRYPSDTSYVARTIWEMYLRHRQVAVATTKCGDCRHFDKNHCGLFDSGYVEPGSWADWSAGWLACGAFWAGTEAPAGVPAGAHEGEVPA
jgi:hypothetical protein